MEEDVQFKSDGFEGIEKTIVKCGLLGLVVAVGALVVRRDAQATLLHNINLALKDYEMKPRVRTVE